MDNLWLKLHYKLINWEWYKDVNTFKLFIHCLLRANRKESKFMGEIIPIGSFVTSLDNLSKESGLTIQETKTALKHLISTNELTSKSTNKFRIITVVNYSLYQAPNKVINNQLTNNQQTTNNQLTTIIECKNEEYKNEDIYNTPVTVNTCASKNELYDLVEKEFGRPLSPAEYELINTWEDNQLTRHAIKEASLIRANSVKYIDRILATYKREGITTLQQACDKEKKFQEEKANRERNKRTVHYKTIYQRNREYLDKRKRELEDESSTVFKDNG